MHTLFENILTASFHGSIVILAVILLRLLLKNTPKKFLCFLWLLAGFRLLMPFEIQSTLSLQPEPVPIVQQVISEMPVRPAQETLPEMIPENSSGNANAAENIYAPEMSVDAASSDVVSPVQAEQMPAPMDWEGLLPFAWLAVAGMFLVYTIASYLSLKLRVREAVRIEGGWECDRIETAFILGFIRPQIYIPMGLSPLVRKHILAHERTHLEKGDHWIKMIGFIALALHWFNPLVWIAYILLCKDIEMACDERVVQFMELRERKEYSAALLNCSTNRAHFAACPVAFGEVSVKHRIKSVLNYKKPGFWISLAGVIAVIFVAVCLVTSPVGEKMIFTGETVTVDNVDDFLAAIGPNREIVLEAGTYNLTQAKTYMQKNGEYYTWEGGVDGSELVISNVENLTIRGSGRLSTTIETDPRWVNVIRFRNSGDVTLEGFTAGHTRDRGECSGGVLYLEGCRDVTMEDLGLYGCGVIGLKAELCTDVTLKNSEVYDCSSSAVSLHTSSNVAISHCRMYDIGLEEFGGYAYFEMVNSQNVTVNNCEFSESTLSNILTSSGTQVTLRNNLFANNRVRSGAFSIQGLNVVLDANKFEGNTIRSWYAGYGNIALDPQGNTLTEAILNEKYPAEPKSATAPQLEIRVTTVDELIAAIGPNKDIVLVGEFYDFSTATGYGTSSGDYYYWEDVFDGPGLVIKNVDNMTIRSLSGDRKSHALSAVPRYADVLAFTACSNITLEGFTAGHTVEPGSCAGGVIEFRDCDNMTVDNCSLYGCGILGVYAEFSKNIQVRSSEIYECSQGGISMRSTDNITINGNTFRDLGGEATQFIGCTNISLDGQMLNPHADTDNVPVYADPDETATVVDKTDLHNLSEAITAFATALFQGDEASMRLNMVSDYALPIEIPEEVIGAALAAQQDIPYDYPNEMETMGYCRVSVNYYLPGMDYTQKLPERLNLEMCREQGIWKIQNYTLSETPNASNIMYLPGNIQIETIERENYTGTVMLIEDPSRVFLGTSTQEAFSKDIPGKRIGEMMEAYPDTVAAVNAGAFFDDGTASSAVGSYPLGLTISNGENVWSEAQGAPGLYGFAGFNSKDELVVLNYNLTPEEAEELDIRDGVGIGPALIINREVQPAAETNSGYAPRTAIGQTADGTVILLCINGRVFNSIGATYGEVVEEMIRYGAVNACLMHGGSATCMMYRPDSNTEPELLTSISSLYGDRELQPRRMPTYWMVKAE